MFFITVIALFSTLMLINILVTESINARLNMYSNKDTEEEDKNRAKLKMILILIASCFLSALITKW